MTTVTITLNESERWVDAAICCKNGWTVGTWLVGDEGYGPTVIRITAIGEEGILAIGVTHNGKTVNWGERCWTLRCRDWKKIERMNGIDQDDDRKAGYIVANYDQKTESLSMRGAICQALGDARNQEHKRCAEWLVAFYGDSPQAKMVAAEMLKAMSRTLNVSSKESE